MSRAQNTPLEHLSSGYQDVKPGLVGEIRLYFEPCNNATFLLKGSGRIARNAAGAGLDT